MTLRTQIAAIRERIAKGTALPGEAAQLAALLRQVGTGWLEPGGVCKPPTMEQSAWGRVSGKSHLFVKGRAAAEELAEEDGPKDF